MPISTIQNRSFYSWTPPTEVGSFSVNYGISEDITLSHPLIFFYDPTTGNQIYWTYDHHYTISNISSASFKVNYTQEAIDEFLTPGTIVVFRNTPLTQETEFKEGNHLPVKDIDDALDKLTMMAQEAKDIFDLSIRVPYEDMYNDDFDPIVMSTLPNIESRKDKFLKFDENGNPTAVIVVDVDTITITQWAEELLKINDSDEARDYLDCAYINGDSTEEFMASEGTDPNSVVILSQITNTSYSPYESPFNIFENSQLKIAQKGRSIDTPIPFTANYQIFDRWFFDHGGDAQMSVSASSLYPAELDPIGAPIGSQCITIDNPGSIIGNNDFLGIYQNIEDRVKSTIVNRQMRVGFWAYSSIAVTGTDRLCCFFISLDGLKTYVHEFEIPVADTWTYISFDIDMTGTSVSSYNGTVVGRFGITLSAGLNVSNATNDIWNSGLKYATANQFDFFKQASATSFYVTNIAMCSGDTYLPDTGLSNISNSYDEDLVACKRWLQPTKPSSRNIPLVSLSSFSVYYSIRFDGEMIRVPTPDYSDGNLTLSLFISGNIVCSVPVNDKFTNSGGVFVMNIANLSTAEGDVVIDDFTEGDKTWWYTCEI